MRYIDLLKFQTILKLPYAFYEVLPPRTQGRWNYESLRGKQGVYFILQDLIPLYIGMSVDIRRRLVQHEFRRFPQRFPWISLPAIHIHVAAMDEVDTNRISATEDILIQRYKPLCNQTAMQGKTPASASAYAAWATNTRWLEEIQQSFPPPCIGNVSVTYQ